MGGARYVVTLGAIERLAENGKDIVWKAGAPPGFASLAWMAHDDSTAYVRGYNDREERADARPEVHRLDLTSGTWMAKLTITPPDPKRQRVANVIEVLPIEGDVLVLSALVQKNDDPEKEDLLAGYLLQRLAKDDGRPSWSEFMPAKSARRYTGGYVWGLQLPNYASSALDHLKVLGDGVLVCAEATRPIRCVNPDTGTELWSTERLWEFDRGFTGPSVWSHHIGRFRADSWENDDSFFEKGRQHFNERYEGSLIGGPPLYRGAIGAVSPSTPSSLR